METKFSKLFNTIVEEVNNDSFLTNNEKIVSLTGTPEEVGKDADKAVETEAEEKPEASLEEKKANFKSICKQLRKAFKEHRRTEDNGLEVEDEGTEDEAVSIEWNWVNGIGHDEILILRFYPATGEATYEDNGGIGDLDLNDADGMAQSLIDEYVLSDGDYGEFDDDDSDIDDW